MPRIGYYIALMLDGKLPSEFANSWKWRPGLSWKSDIEAEGVLHAKDLEETEGWVDGARHGVMAHTWGN